LPLRVVNADSGDIEVELRQNGFKEDSNFRRFKNVGKFTSKIKFFC
jgi:hypothetical protein